MTKTLLPIASAVVGDDGRAGGDRALHAAAKIAAAFGTQLHVVHALDVPLADETSGPITEIVDHTVKLAEAATRLMRERSDARLGQGASEVRVELGRPHAALLRAARSTGGAT